MVRAWQGFPGISTTRSVAQLALTGCTGCEQIKRNRLPLAASQAQAAAALKHQRVWYLHHTVHPRACIGSCSSQAELSTLPSTAYAMALLTVSRSSHTHSQPLVERKTQTPSDVCKYLIDTYGLNEPGRAAKTFLEKTNLKPFRIYSGKAPTQIRFEKCGRSLVLHTLF